MSVSVQATQPELFVELSTEEQQFLSGGQRGRRGRRRRCPRRVIVPRCGPYFRGGGGRGGGGFGGKFDDFDDDF